MKKKAIEKIMFVKDEEPRYKNRVYMSCQTPDIKKEKHLICDFYTKEEGFILRMWVTKYLILKEKINYDDELRKF